MRILGIDPGFAITGYSIIDYVGNKFNLETSGAILTEAKTSFPLRDELWSSIVVSQVTH